MHECDRRTDRQTGRRTDGITITKTVQRIASHGKNSKCSVQQKGKPWLNLEGHGPLIPSGGVIATEGHGKNLTGLPTTLIIQQLEAIQKLAFRIIIYTVLISVRPTLLARNASFSFLLDSTFCLCHILPILGLSLNNFNA